VASDRLFGGGVDPIGREIRIRDQAFKVVGVTGSAVDDQAETIFVPFTALQKMLGIAHLQTVVVAAELAGEASRIGRDITTLLRARHGLPNTQSEGVITRPAGPLIPDDFTVKTQAGAALTKGLYTSVAAFALANLPKLDEVQFEEMASTLARASTTMTALLASIAAVSLIVGGIGIMNIMLVSVTERTREIGLRRALGARRRDLLLQFLVEAIVLSLVGGAIGVGVGFTVSRLVHEVTRWSVVVSPGAVALAFGFAAATGVFFGFYPARKASALNPIDALRYE
jgi:ABC-type antimicrobial peptide transport system permease subunit